MKKGFKNAKKGFTLIELMVVIAIIGILAVVLVPKIGASKNAAKDVGVTQNVSSVAAQLGIIAANWDTNKTVTLVASNLNAKFRGDNAGTDTDIQNPISKIKTIIKVAPASAAAAPAVFVCGEDGTTDVVEPTTYDNYKGSVIVVVNTDESYTVYGVDSNGLKMTTQTIK